MAASQPVTDIHLFMRALALAVTRGLAPRDIQCVEARWTLTHGDLLAGGFILALPERRRVYLEYSRDETRPALAEHIALEPLDAATLYPRPSPHLPPARWSTRVGHLNLRLPKVG
ncbi:hypothetical protein [Enhydrobacter sp.]|jgi:hypothetical protein|uniref:hypothetical protein n=1 Tax=Enhydrobacter sp. TaxID=1894999 RepID=UPI00260C042D|nr:hypothetical protein [Enhydrobacter sp.]WIM09250.1 MAG: hypothetical protein OJF58_000201 [Enhydrobacter sp.]